MQPAGWKMVRCLARPNPAEEEALQRDVDICIREQVNIHESSKKEKAGLRDRRLWQPISHHMINRITFFFHFFLINKSCSRAVKHFYLILCLLIGPESAYFIINGIKVHVQIYLSIYIYIWIDIYLHTLVSIPIQIDIYFYV